MKKHVICCEVLKLKLVSIIVPIYNVELYLKRCIDSLINQKYRNIEIILVDDGSPDNCPNICDGYAETDNRIKVIHKTNGGLSDARNAGLRTATGDLIAFVDSDDWVSSTYIEAMLNAMNDSGADIVECGFIRTSGEIPISARGVQFSRKEYSSTEALQLLIKDHELHQIVWNKLYTRSVIADTLFEVGKYNEDEFWTYQIMGRAQKIVKIDDILYYYYQNNASIMGQGYKFKRLDAIEGKVCRQKYIDHNFPELSNIAATNLMGSIIYAGQMSLAYLDEEEKKVAINILKEYIKDIFGNKKFHFIDTPKQNLWLYMGKKQLVLICKIRNSLRINL